MAELLEFDISNFIHEFTLRVYYFTGSKEKNLHLKGTLMQI